MVVVRVLYEVCGAFLEQKMGLRFQCFGESLTLNFVYRTVHSTE